MFFLHEIKIKFHFQIMHTYTDEVALKYTTPIPIATNRMLQSKIPQHNHPAKTNNPLTRPLDEGPMSGQVSGVSL